MRLTSYVVTLAALMSGTALANMMPPDPPKEPVAVPIEQPALEGGWRYELDKSEPPQCDQPPGEATQTLTFEFAMTGGFMQWTGNDEESMDFGVELAPQKDSVDLMTADGPTFSFSTPRDGVMKGTAMPEFAKDFEGKTFRKCYEAADRSKIRLAKEGAPDDEAKAAYAWLSQGGMTEQPRFVDMRYKDKKTKDLCAREDHQYLFLDLTGPLGFSVGRWNSAALAEKLAGSNKDTDGIGDEIGNWTIEAVEPTDTGWKVTLTELIPPNGSRGDTTTISLVRKGDTLSIPEWKRDYLRCTTGNEATEAPL